MNVQTNKKSKKGNRVGFSMLKILGWTALGGVLGLGTGIGLNMGGSQGLLEVLGTLQVYLRQNAIWYSLGLSLAMLLAFLLLEYKSRKYLRADREDKEDRADRMMNLQLLFLETSFILQFVLFGFGVNVNSMISLIHAGIFLVNVLLTVFGEVWVIQQYKKRDPMKNGDPGDMRFMKDWEESLDEAEKLMTYKAAYKSYALQKKANMVLVLVGMLGKLFLRWDESAMVVAGLLWMIQTVSYICYSMKIEKEGI